MADEFMLPDFDQGYRNDPEHTDEILQGQAPREDLIFAEPPPSESWDTEIPPELELLTEALQPLESAIDDLTAAHTAEIQAREQTTESILKTLRDLKDSLSNPPTKLQSKTNLDDSNTPTLPKCVSDEIDRLYAIEDTYKISQYAEQALDHIINHEPTLLKLPEDPDDQLLTLAMLNRWYTQVHPNRPPLKPSQHAPKFKL